MKTFVHVFLLFSLTASCGWFGSSPVQSNDTGEDEDDITADLSWDADLADAADLPDLADFPDADDPGPDPDLDWATDDTAQEETAEEVFECLEDTDCRDGSLCNGEEKCDPDSRTCYDGPPPGLGFVCGSDPRQICMGLTCVESLCGDSFVDTGGGESCEPPNLGSCGPDCRLGCSGDHECPDDGNECNGEEYCDMDSLECDRRDPLPEGTACGDEPRKICIAETCQESLCGDSFVDEGAMPPEECDNGADNSDSAPDACRMDCRGPWCGDHVTDSEEECDDGPANSDSEPDACRTDCRDPWCGDGVIDSDEDCEGTPLFCDDCVLSLPPGWTRCTDASGSDAFLYIVSGAGINRWDQFKDICRDLIEDLSPEDYEFYGLAVFIDVDIWECIAPLLDPEENYYIGLYQDRTAPDYYEPDGGWYWTGYARGRWNNLDDFDLTGFIEHVLNNIGGPAPVDCGRLVRLGGGWEFQDYSCADRHPWDGVCMIQF